MKYKTLEEVAERYIEEYDVEHYISIEDFIMGAKWQQERSYSEEEVLEILYNHTEDLLAGKKLTLEQWFEQFKKK